MVGLPCSVAARSKWNAIIGGAISTVANCDDTHTGPLPMPATPQTTYFHFRAGAAIGIERQDGFILPSGIVAGAGRADTRRIVKRIDRDRPLVAIALGHDLEVH